MAKIGQKKSTEKKPRKKHINKWNKCDKLFSEIVRDQAGNQCEYCGSTTKQLHCHHAVCHRRYINTRFELSNAVCLCAGCHNQFHDFPQLNMDFMKKKIGSKRIEELQVLARSGGKLSAEEVMNKFERYKK